MADALATYIAVANEHRGAIEQARRDVIYRVKDTRGELAAALVAIDEAMRDVAEHFDGSVIDEPR